MATSYVNRRASFDYELLERFEAGISLVGSEVKSFRAGGVDFRDAFAAFTGNDLDLEGLYIPVYAKASYNNHEPRRKRRLLLNRTELTKIHRALTQKGLTLVPTRMYFKDSYIKVEIALARGKKLYDKRQAAAEKTVRRELREY
jgi:SsrA-binding protein